MTGITDEAKRLLAEHNRQFLSQFQEPQQDDIESTDGPKCPHCGHVHTELDYYQDMVTYWGESEEVVAECEECNSTFFVREQVTRVWESTKTSRTG